MKRLARRSRDGTSEPESEQSREADLREIGREAMALMGFSVQALPTPRETSKRDGITDRTD